VSRKTTKANKNLFPWLNSTVFGIGLASLFSDLSHETVTAVLPALLASMGVAAAGLGTIEGVSDGLSSIAKLYGGWWTDRLKQRKPLCDAGYASMAAATGVIAAATSWWMVLAGRSLAWIARGLRTPARKALLAEAVTPDTYGQAFGFERTMDALGAIAAPLLSLWLLQLGLTQRQLLWLAIVPGLLAVVAIALLVRESASHIPSRRSLLGSVRDLPQPFWKFLWAVGLFGAGDFAHSLIVFYAVTVLSPTVGIEAATATSIGLYALHNLIYAGISYPTGFLADRFNKRSLLALGYGIGAITALLLAFSNNWFPLLPLIFILSGAYVGMEETLEDSLAAELLPQSLRGTGFGVMAIVNGLGDVFSSLSVGWLWSIFSPTVGFSFAAFLMSAGTCVIWLTRRNLNHRPG
jgi:MFS family permease